jgi:nucleoid-associated protein YgaU
MSRYKGRNKGTNDSEMYKDMLEKRGLEKLVQYTTPTLNFPNDDELNRIRTIDYSWKVGDKFWRLASENYSDPKLWWVIAQFNQKPTEGHLEPGDIIKIPLDLAVVLGALS